MHFRNRQRLGKGGEVREEEEEEEDVEEGVHTGRPTSSSNPDVSDNWFIHIGHG